VYQALVRLASIACRCIIFYTFLRFGHRKYSVRRKLFSLGYTNPISMRGVRFVAPSNLAFCSTKGTLALSHSPQGILKKEFILLLLLAWQKSV
jgi:hypothetical protein